MESPTFIPSRTLWRCALTALRVQLCCVAVLAENPRVDYSSPSAVAPGKTTVVNLFGEHLNGATELWTSFPAKATRVSSNQTNEPNSGKVTFHVCVPKDVPIGIGAVQLATTNGVSDLHLIMIDDLPDIPECGTNKTAASAQELKMPVAVDGNCDELAFDYYSFNAKKGQRLSIEVVANRLGSPLDPVVRLLDASGKELVYCDDDPAAGSDSRIRFTAPTSGRYVVELRDVAYQGGPKYRYRLRVGNFPLASTPFPAGARQGARTQVRFGGPGAEGVRPIALHVPENATQVPLSVKFPGGRGSGFVTVAAGRLPEILEVEPNDTPETATKTPVPSVVNGRFGKSRDRDWFEVPAEKGQRLLFSGRTRSLGSPCDLFMRLFSADGKQLAEADISGANEGTLTNKFSESGPYRLLVEELNHQGGPGLAYRIAIEPLAPGFKLAVETNRVQAAPDGTFEIKVTAARREYDGPITLSLPGADFGLENNVIAEKKTDTSLKVRVPARFEAGQLVHFGIIGTARVADADVETTAGSMAAMKKLWPLLRYPPVELDGVIGLGIQAPSPKPDEAKAPATK